jgi:hypothetical protein
MKNDSWSVTADTEHCVHIIIDNTVDITDLELTLINDVRIPILKMKVDSREITICTHTEKPMFAQLGNSVKYVFGSGKEYYENKN